MQAVPLFSVAEDRTVLRLAFRKKMETRLGPQLAVQRSQISKISDVEIDSCEVVTLDTAIAQLPLIEARQRQVRGPRLTLHSINPTLQSRTRLVGLEIYGEEALSSSMGYSGRKQAAI